jgi:hypothetical protein
MNDLFTKEPDTKPLESTYIHDLYGVFIEEQLDTLRFFQELISLMVGFKETSDYRSETWQRCEVYLKEYKIYLERTVRELGELRRTAEAITRI